jgi:nucleoid-associated protein YgaU
MPLSKVTIQNTDTHEDIKALFNPKEYTLSKDTNWVEYKNKGNDVPDVHFTSGQRQVLKMELFFDTSIEKSNVREYVQEIENLMMIIDSSSGSNLKRPPILLVTWGENALNFKCVLEHMDQRYTMFTEEGTPVRAIVNVTFKEIKENQRRSFGGRRRRTRRREVREGDTLLGICAAEYGTPEGWQRLADYNNIDDPLHPEAGSSMSIPPETTASQ